MRVPSFDERGGQLLLEAVTVLFLFGLVLSAVLVGFLLLQRLDFTATMDQEATVIAESELDFALTLTPTELENWSRLGAPVPLPLPALPQGYALFPAGATFSATLTVTHADLAAYVAGSGDDPSFYALTVDAHWQDRQAGGDERLVTLVQAVVQQTAAGAMNPLCRNPTSATVPCSPTVTPP